MNEYFLFVRRVGEFAGQVLAGEVEFLVHLISPLWAIGHIVDDALVGDELTRAAVAVVAAQFEEGDDAVGNVHLFFQHLFHARVRDEPHDRNNHIQAKRDRRVDERQPNGGDIEHQ